MLLRRLKTTRVGMTLIELLVVIAIIAVLVSLTMSAVMMVRGKVPETDTAARIDTLSMSIGKFTGDQTISAPKYIPAGQVEMNPGPNFGKVRGPFRLRNSYPKVSAPNPDRNALDENCFEAQYIARLFPQANLQNLTGPGGPVINADLNANQTLLFFLGGIQTADGQGNVAFQGFSNNKPYPFAPKVGNEDRKMYIEQLDKKRYTIGSGGYAELVDAWGRPLAYFSAYNAKSGTMSGHNPYPGNPMPYRSGNAFANDTTFQLISAGKDGVFGTGGNWAAVDANGKDDRSNFSSAALGAGPTQ